MKKILIAIAVAISFPAYSFDNMNKSEQKEVILSIGSLLSQHYIYPEKSEMYMNLLMERLKRGDYKNLTKKDLFASQLSNDLYKISGDLHFYVFYDPKKSNDISLAKVKDNKQKIKQQEKLEAIKDNFGFKAVEILDGNIGYLKFDTFHDPQFTTNTLASAMQFLSNSDALIIDMRNNNGGYLELAQLLLSYLFDNEYELPLFDYYYNDDGRRVVRKQWVLPSVPGKRLIDIPVYVLTSNFTFSSAEWLTYVLKNSKRATIIGEKTAGGAHPVDMKVINNDFLINIPIGQVIDSNTGDDFEGKGIIPDIKSFAGQALAKAHIQSLEDLKDKYPLKTREYEWFLIKLNSMINPIQIESNLYRLYQGTFGPRKIWLEDNQLYYSWNNTGKNRLIPLSETLFALEGIDSFRFEMIVKENRLVKLRRINSDGSERVYENNL